MSLREHVEFQVKYAFDQLKTPVIVDSAELLIEDFNGNFTRINFTNEDDFYVKFNKQKAISKVLVGYTDDGEQVSIFEGKNFL